ncbi:MULTISPECIES: hypothetical protein [Burkholderia]|uniref:Lipoprotein n=1 Tax=Burkholderia lata (strain ATCC 17760 / DSM 23089 / LMG 22485 / NCIMB 9086 / R18194 / 383) TaxID=482957 RepID=A0A6P2QG36_BURL3|nr:MULTISPECIES: hypothetical protein [Burkholderia]MBN3769063.1 hypothetical protein [Burkholderia sp. Se-20378]MBN3793896.1 hypothetical protein [Burkholderia sp. Ac-20392]VWB59755.1 hypothetical protein BLA6863_02773 [Burkholderia lata]VWC18844.1 hypothetical protein BLA6860_05693 [Burkholderia lata]VWL88352.1 hypothetical protein BLA6992_00415 [Burkholderia lata]
MKASLKVTAACAAISSVIALTGTVWSAGIPSASVPHARVTPPPRTVVATEIMPGVPEEGKRHAEREHGRGPNFKEGKHRLSNGNFQRD